MIFASKDCLRGRDLISKVIRTESSRIGNLPNGIEPRDLVPLNAKRCSSGYRGSSILIPGQNIGAVTA